jgi:DNA-binding SARP family transcriptional activator/tetratricopeptide (TPR) repeat protein
VQVRLLGPVEVMVDDRSRQVSGLRRKAVLATLALQAGEVVSTDQLMDVVWAQRPPPTAVNTLQRHVSHLRGALGCKDAIVARPPGYVLDLGNDATDVQQAERLLHHSAKAADPVQQARHLRAALALWRGRPLADVPGLAWLEEQARRLELLCQTVKRALFDARLAAGEHVQLVPGLEQMVAENPLDEQACAQLMLALYRSSRQADALDAFHRLRRTLAEELGIDPSQALRDLELAILQQDPALDVPAPGVMLPGAASPGAASREAAPPLPAQLPPAAPAFAGRDAELASLDTNLRTAQAGLAGSAPAVVISAVSGTAGVGKTALAVHWAHRVTAQFPDGQLYVNLRGFDPGGALDPAEAVRGFLDALGVAVARIPQGLDAQSGLYRSLLAGKRMLVMLDNARDAEQVRPLLPGSPGCLAIVTSRNQLSGLVAEGARPLSLDLLSTAEARDLLARRLSADRVDSEPGAVDEIIERCARLPLALAIAASRAATSPRFPLAAIAAELRQANRALDPFDGDDLATDVRAVFSWSYRSLTAEAARLFRLLGLHPGRDIGAAAAASLAGTPPGQARVLLAELCRAHLLSEHRPGRYAFHDLLRAYATEQAHAHDGADVREAAVGRVLDHYLHTAHEAAMVMEPYRDPLALARPRPGVIVTGRGTAEDALGWFAAEHATLLAAIHAAADAGFGTHAWQLASVLTPFLLRRGLWDKQTTACQAGLEGARRSGDIAGQAHSMYRLASGYARSGRDRQATPLLHQALRQFERIGDHATQAAVHLSLSWLAVRQQRPHEGLSHSMRAHDLYRAAGHETGQARTLNNIGYSHALLGNYAEALAYCEQSLAGIRALGERSWDDVAAWDSLGYIHQHLGNYAQAITCYQRAVALCRERADRYNEAVTLDHLGDVQDSAGEGRAARQAWEQALRIFGEIDHPDGDQVCLKLYSGELCVA